MKYLLNLLFVFAIALATTGVCSVPLNDNTATIEYVYLLSDISIEISAINIYTLDVLGTDLLTYNSDVSEFCINSEVGYNIVCPNVNNETVNSNTYTKNILEVGCLRIYA